MSEPHVTDHAVLRYLERVYGVDIEGLRSRIGREAVQGCEAGAGAIIVDGTRYVLEGANVITITGRNRPVTARAARWKARQAKR